MNHYIATKIALLDIEACHPRRMQPKRGSLAKKSAEAAPTSC
jgi:hypothetical protein